MGEDELRQQRQRQIREAQHTGDLEGLPRSAEGDAMMQAYIDGEMTTAEMKAKLDEQYRVSSREVNPTSADTK